MVIHPKGSANHAIVSSPVRTHERVEGGRPPLCPALFSTGAISKRSCHGLRDISVKPPQVLWPPFPGHEAGNAGA
jgi:hypothetical protein